MKTISKHQPHVSRNGLLFRYSSWDIAHITLSLGYIVAMLALARSFHSLAWPGLLAAMVVMLLWQLSAQNAIHYHSHTPFFKAKPLNRAFSHINSIVQGLPETAYTVQHQYHHYVVTIDYGRVGLWRMFGLPNSLKALLLKVASLTSLVFVGYCVVVWRNLYLEIPKPQTPGKDRYFDDAIPYILWMARQRGRKLLAHLVSELVAVLAFSAALIWINWRFYLFFYLPYRLMWNLLAQYQEYCEHIGAIDETSSKTDAVSSYGVLYNIFLFNNGYHQEHHLRPGVHWTKLRGVTHELPAADSRRIVPVAHWVAPFALPRGYKPPTGP